MPIRLMFLNTRDQCGADVAVHLTLMSSFDPARVAVHVISNSEAADANEMRERFAAIPHLTSVFLPLGKPSHQLADRGKLGRLSAYLPSAISLAKAAIIARRWGIQVVHATDRPRDASYVTLLGRLCNATSVVHMHAHATDLTGPTLWGMRKSTAIFAVSDAIRRELMHLGLPGSKIHTLHNSVDTAWFDPDLPVTDTAGGALRERFGIPAGAPLAGIAARMNPWKGQIELIRATALLKDRFPDLHVMILGADVPEMRSTYERLAREGGIMERVHFGGFQRDVRPFMREFDLFVHPSYGEPFGLSIAEAMAMRKAVIACDTGGVPEIITHGQDGWLVAERSADAVAEAMAVLLENAELRRRLGQQARETICRRFTPAAQSAAATDLYQRLIASRRPSRAAGPKRQVEE